MAVLFRTFEFFPIHKDIESGVFEYCSSWTFHFFSVNERGGKLGFLNISLSCTSKIFPKH